MSSNVIGQQDGQGKFKFTNIDNQYGGKTTDLMTLEEGKVTMHVPVEGISSGGNSIIFAQSVDVFELDGNGAATLVYVPTTDYSASDTILATVTVKTQLIAGGTYENPTEGYVRFMLTGLLLAGQEGVTPQWVSPKAKWVSPTSATDIWESSYQFLCKRDMEAGGEMSLDCEVIGGNTVGTNILNSVCMLQKITAIEIPQ